MVGFNKYSETRGADKEEGGGRRSRKRRRFSYGKGGEELNEEDKATKNHHTQGFWKTNRVTHVIRITNMLIRGNYIQALCSIIRVRW